MGQLAGEVIEEVFAAAASDPLTEAPAAALRELWESDSWSEEAISATLEALGKER
jgi:hypothetical protein